MTGNDLELISHSRRLTAFVLDCFLFVLTLSVGWVFCYLTVARTGQGPAKRLLRTPVVISRG